MKDPDYAFKLEKAISKKYGPETIVNPSSNWTPEKEKQYLRELKTFYSDPPCLDREEHEGFFVSQKLLNKESGAHCPVCGDYKPGFENKIYFLKFQCCHVCYINFVEGREARWESGWRPKKEKKCQ